MLHFGCMWVINLHRSGFCSWPAHSCCLTQKPGTKKKSVSESAWPWIYDQISFLYIFRWISHLFHCKIWSVSLTNLVTEQAQGDQGNFDSFAKHSPLATQSSKHEHWGACPNMLGGLTAHLATYREIKKEIARITGRSENDTMQQVYQLTHARSLSHTCVRACSQAT